MLSFPRGWKTINQPQSVIGISPSEDAIVELSVLGGKGAESVRGRVLRTRGGRIGRDLGGTNQRSRRVPRLLQRHNPERQDVRGGDLGRPGRDHLSGAFVHVGDEVVRAMTTSSSGSRRVLQGSGIATPLPFSRRE